ncbi:MAG: signal peptidase II, partial [Pseudomonadota bacterium]
MIGWLLLALVIVVADQGTKWVALDRLVLGEPVAFIPMLNFRLAFNPGAAFSFLGDAGGWQRWLFIGLASAISLYIVWWLRTVATERLQPLALSL